MGLPHKKNGSPLAPPQLNYKLYVFSKFSITCLRFFPKSG